MEKLDHELESHILGSTGIGGGERRGAGGLGRSLPPSGRRGFRPEPGEGEVEGLGRGLGKGRETLRLVVGVDAVASADASLQLARGGVSWAQRVQAIGRARAPRRGRHSPVTRVDNVGINRTTVGSARGRSAGAGPDSAGLAGPSRAGQRTGIVRGGDHQRCACTGPGRMGKYRAG